jgi:DNA-binding transcriptional LysR family regulator
MRYTLRQLEVFLAVAESNNVSLAAKALSLSQSATSGALAELEKQFDIQLFDRVGKRLQLNEAGHSLRSEARALLDQANALEQHFRQHAEAGPIKVGATLTIGNYLAVPLLADYRKEHPNHQVSLEVENTEHIAERLLNFEIDMGLIEGIIQHPNLQLEPWLDDELMVFCSPDNPLAKKKKISDKDLATAPWVLRETGSGTRQTFDHAMHDLLPQLDISMELQHTEAIRRAVRLDLGIGCLSKIAVADDLERGTLVRLATPQRNLNRQFWIVLHKQKYLGTGLQQWLAFCRQQAGSLVA